MDYNQSLDYIYSFVDQGFKANAKTYDLTRMRTLLARLGDPQRQLPSAHVAGTKGKGSTSAMLASIMQAAGYRVGMFTSPHLNEFCERIRINDELIPQESLAALTTELRPLFDAMSGITTFEIMTALAYQWFVRQSCNFMVIEVGLGGRLDATNVLMPNVCAITSISYDHINLLGNTLRQIASHKAGIIKDGAPVVMAPQQPEAEAAIVATAIKRGSRVIRVGSDWRYHREKNSLEGQSFSAWKVDHPVAHFDLSLLGEHQIENAVVAIACADGLREQGFKISDEALYSGIANVKWAGRFDVFRNHKTVVLDCAHNRDSMRRLMNTFKELFPEARPNVIFGASDDKDISGMLSELSLLDISNLFIVKANHPRATSSEELAAQIMSGGVARSVKVAHTISHALNEAQHDADIILVTGSIFVVADARAELKVLPSPE